MRSKKICRLRQMRRVGAKSTPPTQAKKRHEWPAPVHCWCKQQQNARSPCLIPAPPWAASGRSPARLQGLLRHISRNPFMEKHLITEQAGSGQAVQLHIKKQARPLPIGLDPGHKGKKMRQGLLPEGQATSIYGASSKVVICWCILFSDVYNLLPF